MSEGCTIGRVSVRVGLAGRDSVKVTVTDRGGLVFRLLLGIKREAYC